MTHYVEEVKLETTPSPYTRDPSAGNKEPKSYLQGVRFELTHLSIVELETTALDDSANLALILSRRIYLCT